MRVTLDTNVLVSGTFWSGEAFRLLLLIERAGVRCFLSKDILMEYARVVHSDEIVDKIEEKHLDVKSSVIKTLEMCELVEPKRKIDAVKEDPSDNKILECAVEARADFIVTYNKHLLKIREFEGIRIVSPTEFLKIFGSV